MSEQAVYRQVGHCLKLAGENFHRHFKMPQICFDLTGKSAGYYKQRTDGSCMINFNAQLLKQNHKDFIARTVPHEIAHLVAYQVYGIKIKPHGSEWKSVMALFGVDDSRCHDYDLSRVQTRQYRRFNYQCGCRSHQLTSIRHNRVKSGHRYVCRQCNQQLRFRGGYE